MLKSHSSQGALKELVQNKNQCMTINNKRIQYDSV